MAVNDGEREAGRFRDAMRPSSAAWRPCRGPGESYSDVILRLVEAEAKGGG
jgi:hypothetical protein